MAGSKKPRLKRQKPVQVMQVSNVAEKMRIRGNAGTDTIELTLFRADGSEIGSVKFSTKDAGQYAAMLLRTAQITFEQSGKPPPNVGEKIEMPVIAFPNSARSAQIPGTDATGLIYHFGEAVIGIAIPKQSLLSLGQELCAASAPTDSKPQ
jgi:hypothetical protein